MNEIDILIGLVIIVILGFAGYKTWQKFTGKASCCGGSNMKSVMKNLRM
ncbi:MAG: FeoB-associated Cys-rich membrane protein [Eubacteriales bacterium]